MILNRIQKQVDTIFEECESLLLKHAVMDGDNLDYFDFDLEEEFITFESQDRIAKILSEVVLALISNSLEYSEIPELLKITGSGYLAEYFRKNDEKYYLLWEFFAGLPEFENPWEPLNQAIREYFDLEKISRISGEKEFEIAMIGYCSEPLLYAEFMTLEDTVYSLEKIKKLSNSAFCSSENQKKIHETAEMLSNKVDNFPKPRDFTGTTVGYESAIIDFAEKLNEPMVEDALFDDQFMNEIFEENSDVNLELLKELYVYRDPYIPADKPDYFWAASGLFKLPMGDPELPFNPLSDIHIIETLFVRTVFEDDDDVFVNYIPQSEWRIVLVRTGLKNEYDKNSDLKLLESQIQRAVEIHECEADKFHALIRWVRYKEDEPV